MRQSEKQRRQRKREELERLEEHYKRVSHAEKVFIKQEPSRWKRFWKLVWWFLKDPFMWIWHHRKDWKTVVIFIVVNVVASGSVWAFYLAAVIVGPGTSLGKWLWGIGSAVWAWWLLPASPYTLIVIGLTIGIRALIAEIEKRHIKNEKKNGKAAEADEVADCGIGGVRDNRKEDGDGAGADGKAERTGEGDTDGGDEGDGGRR